MVKNPLVLDLARNISSNKFWSTKLFILVIKNYCRADDLPPGSPPRLNGIDIDGRRGLQADADGGMFVGTLDVQVQLTVQG